MRGDFVSVTLKHVAERAGLSWQTVSKVLNDQGHLFRPETREAVIKAVHEMGYVPNASARNMRSKQTRQVGLLLRNEEGHQYHNMAAFVVLLGINARLERDGYLLSIVRIGDLRKPGTARSRVFEERVLDGLIAFSQFSQEVETWVSNLIPKCLWVEADRFDDVNCLRRNETHVGEVVAKHILGLGYRKVIWAGQYPVEQSHFSLKDRHDTMASCLATHGINVDTFETWPKNDKRWIYTQLPELLKPDTAVVAYNVHAAQAVLVGAASLGLMIGRDYGLICCDETPEVFEAWPGLCRVANDRFDMGYQAADMMLKMLKSSSGKVASRQLCNDWVIGNTAWGPLASMR
jgi:DNA-binding LacI/PurR family transcriptional regulator